MSYRDERFSRKTFSIRELSAWACRARASVTAASAAWHQLSAVVWSYPLGRVQVPHLRLQAAALQRCRMQLHLGIA